VVGRAVVLVDARGTRALAAKSVEQVWQSAAVLAAHDWVEDALVPKGLAQYLPDDEPAGILDLPSEQYRIRLAAARGHTEAP
jgi:hypothetical protein